MSQRTKSTIDKALDINLDIMKYGSFAEIGAGQEVARQFFQAGKASQTIALTISAYDMTYSDIIYGKEKSGRYVCESRLRKMLEKEYTKLIDRLDSTRGSKTTFFAFADTVATASNNHGSKSHGWMGVRFQHKPQSAPSEVMLHMRLLDKHRLQQQDALSVLGVNLIHSAFYSTKDTETFIEHLFDDIKAGSISVDAIHFSGEAFKHFNEIKANLLMVEKGWSDAVYINPEGQIQNPSDGLWGKNILVQRAFYHPVTNTHIDVADKGQQHFTKEFGLKSVDTTTVFEFNFNNRIKKSTLSVEEALVKVEMLSTLKKPILVTNFSLFYQLKEYLRLISDKPLGIVIGASNLEKLFDEKFYSDLSGGLLEGMGKLLDQSTRLYIYPHKTPLICIQTKSFNPNKNIRNVYSHLIDNKLIQDISGCDQITEFIHSEDIVKLMKKKDSSWKKLVPHEIQNIIAKQVK